MRVHRSTAPGVDIFSLGAFLDRWNGLIRHDLSASESRPLALAELLERADEDDLRRWRTLGLGYADPRGAAWLRLPIAARYPGLESDDVLCCAGAQEGLGCVAQALLGHDDHAIVVVPVYQPSADTVAARCRVTGIPLAQQGDGWDLDIDRVASAIRPETRAIFTNFPNSPTGAALSAATASALIALCRQHGLWLVNDEVYGLTAETASLRLCTLYERAISIDSLSKGFGLPGLRVGWIACRDRALLAGAAQAKSRLSSSLAAPSEILAGIALRAEPEIAAGNRRIGADNRAQLLRLVERHAELFEMPPPGNLAFASPRFLGREGADAFAERLARDAAILIPPWRLWASPLAEVPTDRLRFGLGQPYHGAMLEALDGYLSGRAGHLPAQQPRARQRP
jgi:aspartate/methionine/tyrosine aminotransferase